MNSSMRVFFVLSLISSGTMADDGESEWGAWAEEELVVLKQKDNITKTIKKDGLGNMGDDGLLPDVSEKNEIGLTSSMEGLSRENTDLGVEKIDDQFPDNISQEIVEVVYGTGVSGIDENIINNLDQSSLLDYQKAITINVEFDLNPDNELSTSLGLDEGMRVDTNSSDGLGSSIE